MDNSNRDQEIANLLGIELSTYLSFGKFPKQVAKNYDSWINMLKEIKHERKKLFLQKLLKKYTKQYCCYCCKTYFRNSKTIHDKSPKHLQNEKLYNQDI
jgi:predicted SprT family Zn-dependent metalloprotease